MEPKDKEHPLTLKVMRLTRPTLFNGVSVSCDARDLPADLFSADQKKDVAISSGLPYTGVGQVLLLPQSFGNIYLGETFSCCLCVHNSSPQTISQVSIKAQLQISSERVGLLGSSGEGAQDNLSLEPNSVTSSLIQHEVKEIGTHILVCAVSYLSLGGEILNFRKFYKFQVMKPIEIKTRFLNAEFNDEVFLEAGIENITSGPICLEGVTLEPSPLYSVTSIDSLYSSLVPKSQSENPSVFGKVNVLNPKETRQYLYCLRPKSSPTPSSGGETKPPNTIGKLDIVWRSNMGDKGRLQTSQFVRNTSTATEDITVKVTKIPGDVILEKPVPLELQFTNNSSRTLQFRLEFLKGSDTGSGCEWHCAITRTMAPIPAHQKTVLSLTLIPLKLGIQNICGIRLRDLANPQYIMEVTKLGQLYVNSTCYSDVKEHQLTEQLAQLQVA